MYINSPILQEGDEKVGGLDAGLNFHRSSWAGCVGGVGGGWSATSLQCVGGGGRGGRVSGSGEGSDEVSVEVNSLVQR